MQKVFYIGKGQGNSMEPIINEGDKIYVEKVKFNNLKTGDIVVFYRHKSFAAHRVIRKKNKQIITKGDNSPYLDKPLDYSKILGKLVRIEGKYGNINLSSNFARLFSLYFLFYSLSTYYLPFYLRLILIKILRGRKIITKMLAFQ